MTEDQKKQIEMSLYDYGLAETFRRTSLWRETELRVVGLRLVAALEVVEAELKKCKISYE